MFAAERFELNRFPVINLRKKQDVITDTVLAGLLYAGKPHHLTFCSKRPQVITPLSPCCKDKDLESRVQLAGRAYGGPQHFSHRKLRCIPRERPSASGPKHKEVEGKRRHVQ